MKRGDIVTVAVAGDYGKPRPAVIVQSDKLHETSSVLVALITSTLKDASYYRLDIHPNDTNGLKVPSQIMVDKIFAVQHGRFGKVIGRLTDSSMISLNHMLSIVMGLAD